ncbi:MAG: cell division protein FtsQ/DivIB [Rickettsiales bacterium]|jgi:cell division protein FtsQ|nr:cell division protein FtsQ/DivIB [Rickettsiales bacterium]
MARKNETLTPRQKQSQRIMREKAALKRRREIRKRLQAAGALLACVVGLAGGFWIWKYQVIERSVQAMTNGVYHVTLKAGFDLENLYLEGRSRTPMAEIEAAIGMKPGSPILQASLDDMRARLEKIPSVKQAAVERSLPGTLHIRIVEREPVALWQHKGKQVLVDDNGVVMEGVSLASYPNVPLVIGPDAPKHVMEAISLLSAEPKLAERVVAAVRVGERRWNIRLKNGLEVRLPEHDAMSAWNKLAELEETQQLLSRNVHVIDLRVAGRLFIKLSPEEVPDVNAEGAKET